MTARRPGPLSGRAAWGPVVAIWLALTVPSVGLVQKYLGFGGVVLYGVFVITAVATGYAYVVSRNHWRLSERGAAVALGLTFAAVFVVVLIVHPIIDYAKGDANEALNYAVRELLHGRYPYAVRTQFGNVIAPLPGGILLSTPFSLMSDSAYANFFWLALFCHLCRALLGSWKGSLAIFLTILALAPVILQSLILGGDRISNTLCILVSTVFFLESIASPVASPTRRILASVLLGLSLAWRANFLFLLPILVAALIRHVGLKPTIQYTAVVATTFAGVTLPFYLWNPERFTPTHQLSKLHRGFPLAPELVLVGAAVLSVALAARRTNWSPHHYRDLFRNCALIQAFLYVGAVTLYALDTRSAEATFVFMKEGYGVHFLFFAVLAAALALGAREPRQGQPLRRRLTLLR